MKNVVICYGRSDTIPQIPFTRPKYQAAYEIIYRLASKQGIQLYRASLSWFDFDEKLFRTAWTFDESGWHIVENVKPDLIEDRSKQTPYNQKLKVALAKIVPMKNDPEFSALANSKYETSLLLPDHFKPYYRVNSEIELAETLKKIEGSLVVAKPEFGSGGHGVIIDTPEALLRSVNEFPVILQEFIDSSHGVPGITDGYHDLRLVFINDELIYSYIRIPKEGSLLANVAQGGRMEIIENDRLPKSLEPVIHDVQAAFARFPRKIYTIDLMFDEVGKPWIVELNTMPGVYFEPGQEETRDRFYQALIQELKRD